MSENKWTSEGPWIAFYDEDSDEWSIRINTHGHWGIYTQIAELGFDCEGTRANAHLIAASPAMAEALEALANIPFQDDQNTGSGWAYVETGIRIKDILAARAALSLARGEAK